MYFRNEYHTFFSYGFSKNNRGNISEKELKALKLDAKKQLSLTDKEIEARLRNGTLIEIIDEENVHRIAMNSINIATHAVKRRSKNEIRKRYIGNDP